MRGARGFSLFCTLLTLMAGGALVAREGGPGPALVFLSLLCSSATFIAKSLEFRPDVPAMLFLVLALGLASSQRPGLAGLASGVALLFTTKCVFPIAGLAASIAAGKTGDKTGRRRGPLFFALGVAAPLLALSVWLGQSSPTLSPCSTPSFGNNNSRVVPG